MKKCLRVATVFAELKMPSCSIWIATAGKAEACRRRHVRRHGRKGKGKGRLWAGVSQPP